MSYRSKKVKKILDADLIIFDEAPMASKHLYNCIDKLLRNIIPENKNIPFGGKHFVLGGDFRQVTPVVTKSSRCKIVESSLKCSELWQHFKILKLTKNMRAGLEEQEFSEWLLKLGEGKIPVELGEDSIRIPEICIEQDDLVKSIYNDSNDFKDCCILAPKNVHVSEKNEKINQELIQGILFLFSLLIRKITIIIIIR
jgi:hypothetical protein